MAYCIYTGADIDENIMNIEHIIPLSLGGCDDFTIMVNKVKNSDVNQKVDAKINNDFLMKYRQIQNNYKGHSGAEPILKVKKAKINNIPVNFQLTKSTIKAYDFINKVYLQDLQGEQKVELSVLLDLKIRSKFLSKIALATGYFMFGDVFINNSDHKSLRNYIFSDNIKKDVKLRFYDEFQFPNNEEMWSINRIVAMRKKASGVIWGYAPEMIVSHVFIGGTLLGCVCFSADTKMFCLDNETHDDFGTVIRIENKQLTRLPYRCELQEVFQYLQTLTSF